MGGSICVSVKLALRRPLESKSLRVACRWPGSGRQRTPSLLVYLGPGSVIAQPQGDPRGQNGAADCEARSRCGVQKRTASWSRSAGTTTTPTGHRLLSHLVLLALGRGPKNGLDLPRTERRLCGPIGEVPSGGNLSSVPKGLLRELCRALGEVLRTYFSHVPAL